MEEGDNTQGQRQRPHKRRRTFPSTHTTHSNKKRSTQHTQHSHIPLHTREPCFSHMQTHPRPQTLDPNPQTHEPSLSRHLTTHTLPHAPYLHTREASLTQANTPGHHSVYTPPHAPSYFPREHTRPIHTQTRTQTRRQITNNSHM